MNNTLDDIFSNNPEPSDMINIEALAKHCAEENGACSDDDKALIARKAALVQSNEKLYDLMTQAGMSGVKLECGLSPSCSLKTKYFKAAGVKDEDGRLFGWLNDNELGSVIKPTVHHGSLNSILKTFVEQGGELPEIINQCEVKSIRMNGKSKYLAALKPEDFTRSPRVPGF